MKTRKMALVLALVLALAVVLSGCAKKDDLTGKWTLSEATEGGVTITGDQLAEFGMEMVMELTKDGKATLTVTGEEPESATWTKTDKGITVTDETETSMEFELKDGKLVVTEGESILVFVRAK